MDRGVQRKGFGQAGCSHQSESLSLAIHQATGSQRLRFCESDRCEAAVMSASRGGCTLEAVESRKMNSIGILGLLALSACAHLRGPTESYPIIPQESSSDNVDDEFAGRSTHPATRTAVEAQHAAKARFDSPPDPDKPAPKRQSRIRLVCQQARSTPLIFFLGIRQTP